MRPPYAPAVGPAGTVWMRRAPRKRNGRHVLDHAPARTSARCRPAPSVCASTFGTGLLQGWLRCLARCSARPHQHTGVPRALQLLVEACILALQAVVGLVCCSAATRRLYLAAIG
jgi:hypothetical protein